jgi:hypothetical protein
VAGRGEQGAKCGSWRAQGSHRLGLVATEPVANQSLPCRPWEAQPRIGPVLECVEVGQHAILEGPVGDERPLRRASPGHRRLGRQSQHVARSQELDAQRLYPGDVEGAPAVGGDGRGHLGLAEAGPTRAQPRFVIDQMGEDDLGARGWPHTAPPAHALR